MQSLSGYIPSTYFPVSGLREAAWAAFLVDFDYQTYSSRCFAGSVRLYSRDQLPQFYGVFITDARGRGSGRTSQRAVLGEAGRSDRDVDLR